MKKAWTCKERVLTTLACGQADRVPINFETNPGLLARLFAHFHLADNDWEGLFQALGVDFRGVWLPYQGLKRHADLPERGVRVDEWGVHRMWVAHASGGYWDFCDFPLQGATEEQVAAWPLPSPDDFDYSDVAERLRRRSSYAVFVRGLGLGEVINGTGKLRSPEQILIDLATDDPAGLLLVRRHKNIELECLRRILEAARGGIDFLWMGEDLGTQVGPMISMETYRKHIKPIHQKIVDLAKSYHLPVMVHTCGSSSWAYEEFIRMGINAVDTLQPEAVNMAPEYLKKTFGGRLAFHGCISTAGPVAYGTVDDVVKYCRRTLEIMMPGGGYCFAPTHALQDNSPTENVVAMYETAKRYGAY